MFNKYYEQGYVPIPLYRAGKNPTISKGWTQWCRERPPAELIEQWQEQFDRDSLNIGITCGPASGIVVVDIDVDDPEMLSQCPPSPVRRRGAKGEARFFRYNPKIKSMSLPGLDILSEGRQVVVPPSIHPDTKKAYAWLTPDTIADMRPEDLPALDMSFVETIGPKLRAVYSSSPLSGRNNKLKDIVCAMRGRGEGEMDIIREIYDWDLLYHTPRLFTDPKEGMKASNEDEAFRNASIFMLNVTTSLIRSGAMTIDLPSRVTIIEGIGEKVAVPQYEVKEYPAPTGLLRDVQDLIVDFSERDMPNIALGGAIALMGAVCSNRFRFQNCWSNVYVLNLAPTGAGKSFPQRMIAKILDERLGTDLIGFGNYQSSGAFNKNLVSRRERLDLIDEVSSLFAQLKKGGLWQTSILEEMCKIWSSSSGKYIASEYAEKEDVSSCYNPCVSILGSSTIEGIKDDITRMMVSKGLIPRFLIFAHEKYGRRKRDFLNEALLEHVVSRIGRLLKEPKRLSKHEVDKLRGPIHDPVDLAPLNPDEWEYFEALRAEFDRKIETEQSLPLKDILTRAKEQVMKLSLIHAAGNERTIEMKDLVWAKRTWEVCFHNATPFIEENAVDTDWEKEVQRVAHVFKRTPFVTLSILCNRVPAIPQDRIKKIVDHLKTMEKIQSASKVNSRNKRTTHGYQWCADSSTE